jgi:hypothetical protein
MKQQREGSNANEAVPSNEPPTSASGDEKSSTVTALIRQPMLVRASPPHQVCPCFEFLSFRKEMAKIIFCAGIN